MNEKLKLCTQTYNGVLTNLRKRTDEFDFVDNLRDCDCIVNWQDVGGDLEKLATLNKKYFRRPHLVVQHGRRCVRDYGPPNNFKLLADKFCCWGQDDYEIMDKLGYGDRTVITGCPLLTQIKPKVPHEGRNILFVPVRTMHEEPANITTLFELKKIRLSYAQKMISKYKKQLIDSWDSQMVDSISKNWHLTSKITNIQDKKLYTGSTIHTYPEKEGHTEECVKLLTETDVVVCVEEGTFQVLAMAMDIPLIVVKGFELLKYNGVDYPEDWKAVHTKGATWVELSELEEAIERELTDPGRLSNERKEVVLREFGGSLNPDDELVKQIKEIFRNG